MKHIKSALLDILCFLGLSLLMQYVTGIVSDLRGEDVAMADVFMPIVVYQIIKLSIKEEGL